MEFSKSLALPAMNSAFAHLAFGTKERLLGGGGGGGGVSRWGIALLNSGLRKELFNGNFLTVLT